MNKKILGALVFAAAIAMANAASAQAVRLNVGGAGNMGGLSATALGGGSLANVNLGSTVATIGNLNNGLNTNIDLGTLRNPAGPTTPGTPTALGGDSFFSSNFSTGGGGGGGGGGMQFGDTGYANGTVTTQDARRRLATVERPRKLKRRIASAIRRI